MSKSTPARFEIQLYRHLEDRPVWLVLRPDGSFVKSDFPGREVGVWPSPRTAIQALEPGDTVVEGRLIIRTGKGNLP